MPDTLVISMSGNTSFTDGTSEPIESNYDDRVGVYSPFSTDLNDEISARISQQSDFKSIVETFVVAALDPIFSTATVGDVIPAEDKTLSSIQLHLRGTYTPDDQTEYNISYTYEYCYGQTVEHLWGDSQDFVDAAAMDASITAIISDVIDASLNVT